MDLFLIQQRFEPPDRLRRTARAGQCYPIGDIMGAHGRFLCSVCRKNQDENQDSWKSCISPRALFSPTVSLSFSVVPYLVVRTCRPIDKHLGCIPPGKRFLTFYTLKEEADENRSSWLR